MMLNQSEIQQYLFIDHLNLDTHLKNKDLKNLLLSILAKYYKQQTTTTPTTTTTTGAQIPQVEITNVTKPGKGERIGTGIGLQIFALPFWGGAGAAIFFAYLTAGLIIAFFMFWFSGWILGCWFMQLRIINCFVECTYLIRINNEFSVKIQRNLCGTYSYSIENYIAVTTTTATVSTAPTTTTTTATIAATAQ